MRGSSNDEPSLYGHTTDGGPISDELIEKLADEAEAGYDVDALVARRATGGSLLATKSGAVFFEPLSFISHDSHDSC
jgi:hypothetical protein